MLPGGRNFKLAAHGHERNGGGSDDRGQPRFVRLPELRADVILHLPVLLIAVGASAAQ
jgi:hypothetical protein